MAPTGEVVAGRIKVKTGQGRNTDSMVSAKGGIDGTVLQPKLFHTDRGHEDIRTEAKKTCYLITKLWCTIFMPY